MSKSHVALVKRACRLCHKTEDAEILLATRYNHKGEPTTDLSKHQGQVVGFLEEGLCKECKEKYKADEYFILIEVDESKTEDRNNPFCTGAVIQIKRDSELGIHLFNNSFVKNGMGYIPIEVSKKLQSDME